MTVTNVRADTRSTRIMTLDLLRGLCAVFVAIYHFLLWSDVAELESLGTFPVYTFFVLSSLTMMYAYKDRFRDGIDSDNLSKFFVSRVARVLPLLAVVALVMSAGRVAANRGFNTDIVTRGALTGSGLFSLHLPAMMSNTVGAWSLGIEFLFYLVFPSIVVLCVAAKPRSLLVALAILVAAQTLTIESTRVYDEPLAFYLYTTPVVFAPFFAIGLLIFSMERRPASRNLPLGLIALAAMGGFSLVSNAEVVGNPPVYLMLTLLSGLCVYCLYNSDTPAPIRRLAVVLGDLSYPLYIVHWFAYEVVSRLGVPVGAQFVLFAALAIASAVLARRVIEIPAQKRIRRAFPGSKRAEAS